MKRGRPPKVQRVIAEPVVPAVPEKSAAQAYAERVWKGQSPDTLTREYRLELVRQALEGQGMSMEGVVL